MRAQPKGYMSLVHGRIDMGHNVAMRRAPTISHGSKITGTSLGRVSAA
jgi:hypothetical protein